MIEVEKINEAFIKVLGSESAETDIRDHFTFKAAGYRFSPKFKAGLWNGDISLYNQRNKRLPIGLYKRLEAFCDSSNIEMTIRENSSYTLDDANDVTREEVDDFIHDLDIHLPMNGKPRDYQIDAIYHAIRDKKLTLISPTSSGKSMILYCIIRWILDKNPHARIILMVPTVQLVNQMFSDFVEYSKNNNFNVAKFSQKLFSGQPKELVANILITTWQSLKKVASNPVAGPKIMGTYDAVFADEAHTSKSVEVQNILEKCINASYRIGTTGTLDNEKIHQLVIEGMLGPVYKVITTRELIDNKQVSDVALKCFSLKYPEEFSKAMKKSSYIEEMDFLIGLNKRNDFIASLAVASVESGTTLVLVNNRDTHAKPLCALIKTKTKRPVYYVSGTVSAEKREEIRLLANKENCIIVATYATLSTGVNIPNIRTVIFGSPSKSPIRVLQSLGRGIRLAEGKTTMTLIDIIDDMRHKKRENFAYKHAIIRIAMYRKEKLVLTVKEIPFDVSV